MMAQQLAACMTTDLAFAGTDESELTRTLHTEVRLLGDLAETLRRQREGIARDDVDAVDDCVFRSHRVLRTLAEARRQRRTLVERIVGAQELPLREWPTAFGHRFTPELRHACDRAQAAASVLAREIEINRGVLRTALSAGHSMLCALTGAAPRPVSYAADTAAPVDAPRGAALIDCEV